MTFWQRKLTPCLAAVAVLAGCGTPGIPEPPSLELARPVTDLRATRKGDKVHLTWAIPTKTTDNHNFRHPGLTRICRSVGSPVHDCGSPVGEVPPQKIESTKQNLSISKIQSKSQKTPVPQASYTDQPSSSLQFQSPTSSLIYAVSVRNSYGRSAGFSNQVQVPAAPTLAAPTGLQAQVAAEGVRLRWHPVTPSKEIPGLRYLYRMYRRDLTTNKDSVAGELALTAQTSPTLLDTSFEWEKTYEYRVTVVTNISPTVAPSTPQPSGAELQVEGDDSEPARVFTHDVFPPATPTGLQAVFSGPGQKPFIDLVWTPNNEPDFAEYKVYRHEPGNPPTKLSSEPVKAPAFRDSDVLPGHQYFYSVSAVDVRGNESPPSEEASESVPSP